MKRSPLRSVACAAAAVLVIAACSQALAYVLLGASWSNGTVRFRINPSFPDTELSGDADQQVEIIRCAANAWTLQTKADFSFEYDGRTSINRLNERDGVNAIFWSNTDGGDALAATIFAAQGDRATSFDIIFFATSNGTPNRWSGPGEPTSGQFDIGGVAAHELGHALGLDHTPISGATMFASASGRALPMRTLHADDAAGCAFLYGSRSAGPAVRITAVNPPDGPSSGGNEVVLTGDNFTYDSDTQVRIDGAPLDGSRYDVESCDRIRITRMPAHAAGGVSIEVTNTIGSTSLAGAYHYGGPSPRILSIEPSEGPALGGIDVAILGEGLGPDAVITIGGNPLENLVVLDGSTIEGTLPSNLVHGPVDVRLEQGGSVSVLTGAFSYNAYLIRLDEVFAGAGQHRVPIDVLVTSPSALTGASFGLSFDSSLVQIAEISVVGSPAQGAAFIATDYDNVSGVATFTMGVGFGDQPFPPGSDLLLARVLADVSSAASPGTEIPLTLEDGIGSPPTPLSFIPLETGDSIRPTATAGLIEVTEGAVFLRGDSNGDAVVDIADPVFTLSHLFQGGDDPTCPDAADANDDGDLDISDGVSTLLFLFQGGAPLPFPHPVPGPDPTGDPLGCG